MEESSYHGTTEESENRSHLSSFNYNDRSESNVLLSKSKKSPMANKSYIGSHDEEGNSGSGASHQSVRRNTANSSV